jgi:hypothetical protein
MVALISMSKAALVVSPVTDAHIHVVRGQRVMLDSDLASLYGVPTGALNRAVKRNADRFPGDFMFQLTPEEHENLKCQFGISPISDIDSEVFKESAKSGITSLRPNRGGGRSSAPHAFTQEGVAMLSSVLRSPRAVAVNIEIMRAFVRLRRLTLSVKELSTKVEALEQKYDGQFGMVFEAIKELMTASPPPPEEEGTIGFLGRPKKRKSS